MTAVRREASGVLEFDVAVEAGRDPRWLMVGVTDGGRDVHPQFATAAVRVPYDLVLRELVPGSSVSLDAGGTRHGPVRADGEGTAVLSLQRDPRVRSGKLVVRTPGGRETTTTVALADDVQPVALSVTSAPRRPGDPLPGVWLHAVDGRGRARGGTPTCVAPGFGPVPVASTEDGTWAVGSPPTWATTCGTSASGVAGRARARSRSGCPSTRASRRRCASAPSPRCSAPTPPSRLCRSGSRTPSAARIDPGGRLEVEAELGLVSELRRSGAVARAEYRGDLAAEAGRDTLIARWFAEPGAGPVDRVEGRTRGEASSCTCASSTGSDARSQAARCALRLGAMREEGEGVTAADGWSRVLVPGLTPGETAVVLVHAERRVAAFPVLGGARGELEPGQPDLSARVSVQVDPGRAAEVAVSVTPGEVRPGPQARARVRVAVKDRSGGPSTVENPPELVASEGVLTGPSKDGPGAWVGCGRRRPASVIAGSP